MMETPRYTAQEIEEGLYSGMDPDVELVAAQYYDALRAELARVKAESLRVVESECQDMNIASDWYMTPDGLGWLGYDRHDCECVETSHGYHKFDECRKVKLERWEDE